MSEMGAFASRLVRVGAAPIADAGGRVLDRRLVALWPGATAAGPALTVHCAPGDNLALQVAVAQATPGAVLVVDAGGPSADRAVWGEVMAAAAAARGISGMVLDGLTRDVGAVTGRRFPVWAAGRSPAGPTKTGPGSVGATVQVGGVSIEPGEWVIGDGDGVVVIGADDVEVALDAAEAKARRESEWFGALARGATTIELFGLDPASVVTSLNAG